MFNSTHTLVGILIAKTGVEKWAPYGLATAVIASNLPDIDIIAGFWGTAPYLDYHRGITHSLIGVPLLAMLLSAVMYFLSRSFLRTYAIALIAMATHPALDYLNSYGVRPFLPWSDKWYFGDLTFILDPYLDALLLAGVIIAWYWPERSRIAVAASVILAACYVGLRIETHSIAVSQVRPRIDGDVTKWAVLPTMWGPWSWDVVVEGKSLRTMQPYLMMADMQVPFFGKDTAPQIVLDEGSRVESTVRSEAIVRASMAPNAAALLRFARFPVTQVVRDGSNYRVIFFDYRFYRPGAGTALAAKVTLDSSLNEVLKNDIGFALKIK